MKPIELFAGLRRQPLAIKPFTHMTPSLGTTGRALLLLLLPQVAMLFVTKSTASLLVLLAAVLGSLAGEALYNAVKRQFPVSWIYALMQGIIIGLLLPSGYPPLAVFCLTLGSLLLCTYAFGGFAASWANPAVVTVVAAYMLGSAFFPPYLLTGTDVQARNAALLLLQNGSVPPIPSDAAITGFLNRNVFSIFGIVIPEGYVTLFWDCGAAIPAFRFNLITLLSSVILISLDMIDALIPFVFIAVYAVLVRCAVPVLTGGMPFQGDVLLALLTSGTLFCTLYVLQWYGTTPMTLRGKLAYAVIAGVLAFLIVGYGTSPVGYVFMVLVMNVVSPLIQVIESKQTKKKIKAVLVPRLARMKEVEHG